MRAEVVFLLDILIYNLRSAVKQMLVPYRYDCAESFLVSQRPTMVNWYCRNRNNINDVWLAHFVARSNHTTNQLHSYCLFRVQCYQMTRE